MPPAWVYSLHISRSRAEVIAVDNNRTAHIVSLPDLTDQSTVRMDSNRTATREGRLDRAMLCWGYYVQEVGDSCPPAKQFARSTC